MNGSLTEKTKITFDLWSEMYRDHTYKRDLEIMLHNSINGKNYQKLFAICKYYDLYLIWHYDLLQITDIPVKVLV